MKLFRKKWTISGDSQCGPNRAHNEDSIAFKTVNRHYSFAVVCDGVGGNCAGNIASSMASQTLAQLLAKPAQWQEQTIKQAVRSTHKALRQYSNQHSSAENMATTLVMAIQQGEHALIVWAGDSRAYWLDTHGHLQQISHDHSFVAEKVAQGVLSPQEAQSHPMANMITSCLGGTDKSLRHIGIKKIEFKKGARLLLMTDGIYNAINEKMICQNSTTAAQLISCAIDHNTSDNASAIVIQR